AFDPLRVELGYGLLSLITEHVRARLSRQLCHQYVSAEGHLPVIALSRGWEEMFHAALANSEGACRLAIAPGQLQAFTQSVQARFDAAVQDGETPVLLTCARLRPHVRFLIERFRAQTPVLSQNEIHPSVRLRALGWI
ncbi:MAG: FHIPEP family type III secretion protein, partial [Hyphomicrobium sp.]